MKPLAMAALLLGLATGPAQAHATLEGAEPGVGATLPAAPTELHLRYSTRLEPGLSRVELRDEAGQAIALGPPRQDEGAGNALHVPLARPLVPGLYRVTWQVVSSDGHATRGRFTFRVGSSR